MSQRHQYRRKPGNPVTAVRIELDLVAFSYRKWGHENRAESGDWIVDNGGDVYTIKADEFERTYKEVGAGRYEKKTCIWAEEAREAGTVSTREGKTNYEAGDFIVYDDEEGPPKYAISASKFHDLYDAADDS